MQKEKMTKKSSLILSESSWFEVCLPIGIGMGLLFAVLIQVQFPPLEIRDSQSMQMKVFELAEA